MLGLPATGMEYLCGVVHDIGKLVLAELYPAKMIGVWMHAYEQNLPLTHVEQQYFGVDHTQIGQEWLNRHRFDRTVRYVTAYHEEPENCMDALAKSGKMAFVTAMIAPNKDDEINLLTHLIYVANTLAKELGLGYAGNPRLDQAAWIDQPNTQLIFESRQKEEVTLEEFNEFFTVTCKGLPDLPFAQLAHASEARQRSWERAQKEEKGKK
jgi:hypothetical protein